LLSLTSILSFAAGSALLADDWPHWRGPSHNSVSTETNLPVTWGAKCLDGLDADAASNSTFDVPDGATAPQQGRGGRGGGAPQGGREGRPMTPFSCANLDTQNVAWKIALPAY